MNVIETGQRKNHNGRSVFTYTGNATGRHYSHYLSALTTDGSVNFMSKGTIIVNLSEPVIHSLTIKKKGTYNK